MTKNAVTVGLICRGSHEAQQLSVLLQGIGTPAISLNRVSTPDETQRLLAAKPCDLVLLNAALFDEFSPHLPEISHQTPIVVFKDEITATDLDRFLDGGATDVWDLSSLDSQGIQRLFRYLLHFQKHATFVEQEQAERTRNQYQTLARNFPNGTVYLLDLEGRILLAEGLGMRQVGLESGSLTGKTLKEVFGTEKTYESIINAWRKALAKQEATFEVELRGRVREVRVVPVQEADGTITSVMAMTQDITERKQAEAALRASQERLQAALDGGLIGLWDWDIEHNVPHFSPQWKNQLGYSEDEIEDTWSEFEDRLHPEDKEAALQTLRQSLKSSSSAYYNEFRMRHRDGSYRWLLARGTIFRRPDGTPHRAIGSHVDITDLKEAQTELLASRADLQRAHDELERRVGERTAELKESNLKLHAEAVERQMAVGALREMVGKLEQAKQEAERANVELRTNEGRLIEGNRIFAELAHLRVTTQTELEQALHQITEAGSKLLEVERCSIWAFNEDRSAISCLDLYERCQGKHSSGLRLTHCECPDYFNALLTQREIVAIDAASHPATHEFKDVYLKPLGIASMLDTAILIGGQCAGVLCCEHVGEPREWKVDDQTFAGSAAAICSFAIESYQRSRAEAELRQAKEEAEQAREEAERANAAKSDFLSRMSHELRTPMNSILGFAQIMEMQAPEGKQAQRVAHILKAGRHLLQMIDEVLDLARVESGRLSLSPEPTLVGTTIETALDLIRPLCDQQELRLIDDTDHCADLYVLADQRRLSQVLLNLLSNANKYNRKGGHIRLHCEKLDSHWLRISISDTGIGIPPQYLSRLFRPFERLAAEGSSIEGTGLGLALSKGLIESMGGKMGVESVPGQGSTFWIELQLTETLKVEAADLTSPVHVTSQHQSTVLYIEDNLTNLQVIEEVLESQPNIRLVSAMQGQMGLDLAREHQPALVLLDLHLPDIPGEEVMRRLRAEPLCRDIPVVIISADATPTQIRRLTEAGADAYLTKPLDIRRFLEVVQEILRERED